MVFINIEKVYDTIPRDLTWYCLRRKNVLDVFIDMYDDNINLVNTTVGETGEISK